MCIMKKHENRNNGRNREAQAGRYQNVWRNILKYKYLGILEMDTIKKDNDERKCLEFELKNKKPFRN